MIFFRWNTVQLIFSLNSFCQLCAGDKARELALVISKSSSFTHRPSIIIFIILQLQLDKRQVIFISKAQHIAEICQAVGNRLFFASLEITVIFMYRRCLSLTIGIFHFSSISI